MKKLMILMAALSVACAAGAQSAQADFEKTLPDSVKYVLPAFGRGTLLYRDGTYSMGMFNISTLDQTLRFIDADGSEKALTDNSSVDRLSVGSILFIHPQNAYLGVVETIDDVMLCVERRLRFDDSKSGAYGTTSSTTNIKTVSVADATTGVRYKLSGDLRYEVRETPYLYYKKRLYVPSAKRFRKCFPDKAASIDACLAEHPVDFADFASVRDLMERLKTL